MSEALIFASTTNPQYDEILFIELQVQYMKIPSSNLGRPCWVQKLFLTFRTIFVHYCSPNVLQKEELLTKIYLYNRPEDKTDKIGFGEKKSLLASKLIRSTKKWLSIFGFINA